jgi:osmoprotectant transport system ATP-binding protein
VADGALKRNSSPHVKRLTQDQRDGAMFSLERVSKRFGTFAALEDLTLQFPSGAVTAVIGSSGSGKSTMLRLLLGLELPDAGLVRVDDEAVSATNRLAIRRRIGYVIQEGGLFPHLSVRDNLALVPRYLNWSGARIDARARELAELVEIPGSALSRFPLELSGGQRQRVAVMRALMADPPALLLDEPLGALDPLVRFELQQRLRQLFHVLGKTVVLVTHDLPEAAFIAPRLVLLRDGRVVQDGAAAEFYNRPADEFVRRFVAAYRPPPLPHPEISP